MQAWNQVKVKSKGKHQGVAGLVIRVEGQGADELVTVKLDGVDDPVVFTAAELDLLGGN